MSSQSLPLPTVPGTDPTRCILDSYRIAIAQIVGDALGLKVEQIYPGVQYGKKGVDFTVALPRFRLPGAVVDLATKVVEKFQPNEYVTSIRQDKAFLHFILNTNNVIKDVLMQVDILGSLYGTNQAGSGKRVLIDIHHRILQNHSMACGWEVAGLNYLGDWGTQFGLIAVGFKKYRNRELLEQDAIKHLFDVYVKINKEAKSDPQVKIDAASWFRRMEDHEPEALANLRVWRELSVRKYEGEYDRLNVHFDVYTGESEVSQGSMDRALERLEEMGMVEENDGAKLVNLEQWNLGKAVLRKRDGASIYLTRDIGSAIERQEKYNPDKVIYVVSSQQDLHLAQLFKVLELMGYPWARNLLHINHGLVQGMSTRKGTVKFLEQVIQEATQKMHGKMLKNDKKYRAIEDPETTSREIGITGIKIQDMTARRKHNYTFDWERMFSIKRDTGSYLQYAHVRLASLGRQNPNLLQQPRTIEIQTDALAEYAQVREIVMLLGSYPDVVLTALKTHEPSGVVTFLFRLAHAISSAWEVVIVKGEKDLPKAKAKMWLFECARIVLRQGMQLLSIRPLERM